MNEMRSFVTQPPRGAAVRPAHRLLVYVDGSDQSRWGLNYARMRHRRGEDVTVELVFVVEPVQNWQVLRFWTRKKVARFQADRGRFLLDDAERYLREAGVPVSSHYREGDTLYEMLDLAEKLHCGEIVLPAPERGFTPRFNRDLVKDIQRRSDSARLVMVDASGYPCTNKATFQ